MLVLPLGIVWIAALAVTLMDGRRARTGWAACVALAGGLAAVVWLGADVLRDGPRQQVAGDWPAGVGITLRADALGVLFAGLSLAVLLAALVYETIGGIRSRTFPALVLYLGTGLTGLCLTGDAFNFYVFFEIAMISAYILTGYGERTRQLRAAAIFAVVNLLGSVLFLIGIAALYHVTGRLDMAGIAARTSTDETTPAFLSATIIFVAFGVKLGLFPFHFWLPAVYSGTRPAVAAILSGALANIGSYGILRFGADLLPRELADGAPALALIGALSIVYGAVQAIARHAPSEVLAYSSIGQVGYILLALAIGGEVGYTAAILYAVVNSLNKTLLFLAGDLRGRWVGVAFLIGALSVAGVPPAAGFFGKAAVFRAAIADADAVTVGLVFVGGALSFVYMFQSFGRRFWELDPSAQPRPPLGGVGPSAAVVATHVDRRLLPVAAVALLVLGLGVWPEPLLALSARAAEALPAMRP